MQASPHRLPGRALGAALALAACALAPAHAEDNFCGRGTPHPIDQAMARAGARSSGVTLELRAMNTRALQAWDKELNRVYQALLQAAGKERADALRAAQRAWLAYDKAQLRWDWALHADEGTSAPLNVEGAALTRLRQRVCELSTDLEDLQGESGQR